MARIRRKVLVLLGLVFICAISLASPELTTAEPRCPWPHFGCPSEQYDCCCMKGVRCDLNEGECEAWCNGW